MRIESRYSVDADFLAERLSEAKRRRDRWQTLADPLTWDQLTATHDVSSYDDVAEIDWERMRDVNNG